MVSTSSIKDYIRVPQITAHNMNVKKEIIKHTEKVLALEEKTLSDFIDFSAVLIQKFDDVKVDGRTLILYHDKHKTRLPIKSDTRLVATAIAKKLGTEEMKLEKHQVSLSELHNMQVIDFKKQARLKDYIDDLVFALYFLQLKDTSIVYSATKLKENCSKSKYYKLIKLQ